MIITAMANPFLGKCFQYLNQVSAILDSYTNAVRNPSSEFYHPPSQPSQIFDKFNYKQF